MQTVGLEFSSVSTNALMMYAALGWLASCAPTASAWQHTVMLRPLLPDQVKQAMAIAAVPWTYDASYLLDAKEAAGD